MTEPVGIPTAWLVKVLPPGVVSRELRLTGDDAVLEQSVRELALQEDAQLYPEEEEAISRAVSKRKREFLLGRLLARRAFSELGFAPQAILPREDRSPGWPETVVGSITHTQTKGLLYVAAAVARAEEYLGVGIDAELATGLGLELFPRVLREAERVRISSAPESARALLAKLCFCAKEAAYKCQYPATRRFLGFEDAEVNLPFIVDTGRELSLFFEDGPFERSASASVEGELSVRIEVSGSREARDPLGSTGAVLVPAELRGRFVCSRELFVVGFAWGRG